MSGRRYPSLDLDARVGVAQREHVNAPFRVDTAELVAFVRSAPAVEGPAVAGAHELVVDDVPLGQIVVEVGADAGRAVEPAAAPAPHDVLGAVDLDRDDRAGR